jgi:hypothetical protein
MTWKELEKLIKKMSEDQKNTDVTIVDMEAVEAFPVNYLLDKQSETFGLDENHPYLAFRDDDKSVKRQIDKT